ncbi:hypothetical protein V8E54_006188 [Elaphomyces granulatus]
MDGAECSAVYIDDRVKAERWVRRGSFDSMTESSMSSWIIADESETLQTNVKLLLDVCRRIYLCHSAKSFAAKLAELNERSGTHCAPIFAFVDVGLSCEAAFRRHDSGSRLDLPLNSFSNGFTFLTDSEDSYGLQLLAQLSSGIQLHDGPNLVVPVVILRSPESATNSSASTPQRPLTRNPFVTSGNSIILSEHENLVLSQPSQIARCLDAGAVDVLTQPLERARVHGLAMHAYRARSAAQKALSRFLGPKKSRKQSWVGVSDEQPYAYLREAMVSKLMKSICNPEEVIDEFHDCKLFISEERKRLVECKLGDWDFPAHDFSDDELVYGAYKMFEHALKMPEMEHWRLTTGELQTFCLACRAAYNSFVLYHNFRHAVDVLQSTFSMLLHIGLLPPYTYSSSIPRVSNPAMASLLTPFDVLTLLISAIGHDVGHPGVNNRFLVELNSPLAQLYNDNSVLEAFHCAAFSQILRRHWPAAFKDATLRRLLINTILATDMCLHFDYLKRLKELQQKYQENNTTNKWNPSDTETYRTLLCGLLIKCADISNVARHWPIAEKWTSLLQEEFANQGEMEKEVGMQTTLMGGPPELGNLLKLANGQISFMSICALPLFEGVADLLPPLSFTVQRIRSNKSTWQKLVDRENSRDLSPCEFSSVEVLRSTDTASASQGRQSTCSNGHQLGFPSLYDNQQEPDSTANIRFTFDLPHNSSLETYPSNKPTSGCKFVSSTGRIPVLDLSENSIMTRSGDYAAESLPLDACSQDVRLDAQHPSETALGTHLNAHPGRKSCSSGQGSLPSTPYGSCRDTRAQSGSTCTNTIPTPISPATNATSIVTVDSDERDGPGSGSCKSDLYSLEDVTHSRPTSPALYETSSYGHYCPQNSRIIDDLGKQHHVMTTVIGNDHHSQTSSLGNDHENGGLFCLGNASPPPVPSLPKRRSRLRLAFWRRKS